MSEEVQTEEPSEEELFYKKWGWETLKESISTVNGIHKLFITLDAAILSAYLGFYEKITILPWMKIILFILLIISLCSSLVGVYPFSKKVNLDIPREIKSYKSERLKFKIRCLTVASCALIAGFIGFLVAILVNS